MGVEEKIRKIALILAVVGMMPGWRMDAALPITPDALEVDMANCSQCGMYLGLLNAKAADEIALGEYRKKGYWVPMGMCSNCAKKYTDKIISGEITPRMSADVRMGKLEENERKISEVLSAIRITTYAPRPDEKHTYCGLVTATAAIGTGPISQIVSSFTDLFGKESGTYNDKLRQGEKSCILKIQQQAVMLNANAIAGTHITYTELTSGHGMVLVCVTGTAISLECGPQEIRKAYEIFMEERAVLFEPEKSTSSMMSCPQCGTEINRLATLCPKCKTKFADGKPVL